jgi:ABC-2 type transport system ATP-binding protein
MLKISHLHKTFGEVLAVDDLSIEIVPREIFGLLGPNGAGKTTTVSLAVGLLDPDGGTIEVGSWGSPGDPEVRARIGLAPQALAIYEEMSGEENLAFFARLHGFSGSELRDRVDWALDFVDLAERRRSRAKTYSGGMKRRLNLAAAVLHRPPLLFLDEPTVGVDPQSRNAIFDKILRLRDEGSTIVYTTHYMEEAQRLCDRVGILDRGRLLDLGSVPDLIVRHGGKSLLTVEGGDGEVRIETNDPLAELKEVMKKEELTRFSVEPPDLERVFLNLTGRHLRD